MVTEAKGIALEKYEAKTFYRDGAIAQGYDSQYRSFHLSGLRARIVGWWEVRAFLRLIRHAPLGGDVLDLACGTGRYTELLLGHGYRVCGLDIAVEMMALAKRRLTPSPDLSFWINGDGERLPFADGRFAGATCMRLFHRTPPAVRLRMLGEIKRVCRDWAIMFFGMTTPWLRLRHALRSGLIPGRVSNPYPISPIELRRELESLGFTIKDCVWVLPYLTEGMLVFANC